MVNFCKQGRWILVGSVHAGNSLAWLVGWLVGWLASQSVNCLLNQPAISFWSVSQCETWGFGGPCCLHLHAEDGSGKVLRNVGILAITTGVTTHLHPEDGGSMIFRNVGIQLQHYMVSQSRRQPLEWVSESVGRSVSESVNHLVSLSVYWLVG
jgi:hypothetical protein